MPSQTALVLRRAVASLLRLANLDLKDAELLRSGRYPANAPALLGQAADRLLEAVLATEHGWPFPFSIADADLVPDRNPLKERTLELIRIRQDARVVILSDDGNLPVLPEKTDLRVNILIIRAALKTFALEFDVDLFGTGDAGKVAPVRLPPKLQSNTVVEAKPELPKRSTSNTAQTYRNRVSASREQQAESRTAKNDASPKLPEPFRFSAAIMPQSREVEVRASIEVSRGSTKTSSIAFWALMDRWRISDTAALELIGHPNRLTKKGTRPRFKLIDGEVELFRSLQEIDTALIPLQVDPGKWLNQPIDVAPFIGATPIAYLTRLRMQGVHDTLRFILQQGLKLSISGSKQAAGT